MRLNLLVPVSVDTFGFTVFFADFATVLGLMTVRTVSGASVKSLQTVWEGPFCVEKNVAFSVPLGCRGKAHDSQQLECRKEARATRRRKSR